MYKWFSLSLFLVCFTFSTQILSDPAKGLSHFYTVKVNPKNSFDYQLNTTIHLVWLNKKIDPEEELVAKDIVTSELRRHKLLDLESEGITGKIKSNLLDSLNDSRYIQSNRITKIYISEFYVKYMGKKTEFVIYEQKTK